MESPRAAKRKTYDNLHSQLCGRGDMVAVCNVQYERATHEGNINFSGKKKKKMWNMRA